LKSANSSTDAPAQFRISASKRTAGNIFPANILGTPMFRVPRPREGTSSRRRGTEYVTQVGEILRSGPDWHTAQDDTLVRLFYLSSIGVNLWRENLLCFSRDRPEQARQNCVYVVKCETKSRSSHSLSGQSKSLPLPSLKPAVMRCRASSER
jgi:hypothetical protein